MKTFKLNLITAILIVSGVFTSLKGYGQWSAPVDLTPNAVSASLNESMGTCIGVSGDSVHVVWVDRFSSHKGAIYYRHSLDTGITWSNPIALTDLNGDAWLPTIAVNGPNIHVAWRVDDTITNKRTSWYKHSTDGGTAWGPNVFIDSTADWPAIAVSGNYVYIVNDRIVSQNPYNTEIFFLRSLNNGVTWSAEQRLTFANGRSEDEGISAQGSHIHMAWNDNRTGQFQIIYKESSDYGATWDSDIVVMPPFDYGTMVSIDGSHTDVIATGTPSGHNQVLLAQSADTGATWAASMNITNDTAVTYYYPDMVRDGSNLHVVYGSSISAQYLYSGDGGATWDAPFNFTGGATFIAYGGCALHIICLDSNKVHYLRNPVGNLGPHCQVLSDIPEDQIISAISVYPNPATNILTIHQSKQLTNQQLLITNILGEEIYHQPINNSTQITIDVSQWSNGVYFYKIRADTETLQGKFVVEK